VQFAICIFLARALWAREWRWGLAVERYRKLNVFQRAQYDKAARLLRGRSYKAAASEFEKFKVQFPDSPILPYVLFMRGYCLQQAKLRNRAIKVYNEVLDYFADEVDDAAPALYFMGVAHFDNGEGRKGMKCMRDMVEDEDYRKHPLAGGALARIAENHWENNEYDRAVSYWKQIVRDFSRTNHAEAGRARQRLIIHYIKNQDYAGYEAWAVNDKNRDNARHRRGVVTRVMDQANHVFARHSAHYGRFEHKKKSQVMKACFDYFASRKVWFEKTKSLWDYYTRAIGFLSHRYRNKKERDRLVDQAIALVKASKDKKLANQRYAWLCDRLREAGDYLRARYCVGLMTDPPFAAYKECEILIQQQKWKPALARLEQIEKMGDAQWAGRALERRAWIYVDHLRNYETAIKLYHQLNRPPWTLWQIQECYMRWGKLDEAIATLTEIQNMFPPEAPKAAWCKARYYHEARQAKKAISMARKILKAYKKSREASLAHQLLEKYGVPTGGGVFDGENE